MISKFEPVCKETCIMKPTIKRANRKSGIYTIETRNSNLVKEKCPLHEIRTCNNHLKSFKKKKKLQSE